MAISKVTVDHEEIRRWVESRGGYPARVKGTGGPGDAGLLRIDFPGFRGVDTLERIGWSDWFDAFEENNLAFIRSEDARNRFSKLVARDTVDIPSEQLRGRTSRMRRAGGGRMSRAAPAGRGSATKRTATKKRAAAKKRTTSKRATARPAAAKRRTTTGSRNRVTTQRNTPKKRQAKRGASKSRPRRASSRMS